MNLLNRLKPTKNIDHVIEEVKSLEQDSGIILPPVFKAFIINFELKSYYQNFSRMFFIEKIDRVCGIDDWVFQDNDEIGIESFLRPSEYLMATRNVYHYEEDQEIVRDKIVFANIFGGTLLIGYGIDNMENIYADFIAGERAIKVANDIFEFFRKFEVSPMQDTIDRLNILEEGLYKRYGETFWRYRPLK